MAYLSNGETVGVGKNITVYATLEQVKQMEEIQSIEKMSKSVMIRLGTELLLEKLKREREETHHENQ